MESEKWKVNPVLGKKGRKTKEIGKKQRIGLNEVKSQNNAAK